MSDAIEVRAISAADTIPLRVVVLRPNRPIESAQFPGDDLPTTKHFGVFRDGKLFGIASLFIAEMVGQPGVPAVQLRGMATSPQVRGEGFGRALVLACMDSARSSGAKIFWFNARIEAVGFYEKLGFQTSGAEFDIPDVGPHLLMWWRI